MLNSARLSASSINFSSHSFNKYLRSSPECTPRVEKTTQKSDEYSPNYGLALSECFKHEAPFDRKSSRECISPTSHLKYSSSSDLSNLDLLSSESEMPSPPPSDGHDRQKVGHSRPSVSNLTSTPLPPIGVSTNRYSPMFIQHDNFSSPFHSPTRPEGSIGSKKKDLWSSGDFSDISPPQLSLDFLDSGKPESSSASTLSSQAKFQTSQFLQEESQKALPVSRSKRESPRYIEPKLRNPLPSIRPISSQSLELEGRRNMHREQFRYSVDLAQPSTFQPQPDLDHYLKQKQDEDFASCLTEINRLSLATQRDQDSLQDKLFASSRSLLVDSSSPALRGGDKSKLVSPRVGGVLRDIPHESELDFQDSQSSESDEDSESSLLATQPLPNLNLELEENLNSRSWQAKRGLLAELYKTEICLNWLRTRNCSYGNKCHYAHGIADLRARQRIETYKTQPCADPARKGCHVCMYTTRCNYAHPGEPIRRMGPHSGKKYFDNEYFEALRKSYPYHEMPFGVFV